MSDTHDGLLALAGAEHARAVLGADLPSPPDDLHHAFSDNQLASKTWLLDKLFESLGGRYGTVYVLGGWYGVLGAMLLNDARFEIGRVLSFDVDGACEAVADGINQRHVANSRFKAITADVRTLDYRRCDGNGRQGQPNLVINTSCEHMSPAGDWYDRLPHGMLQAFQSNDYFECPEHVNCVADLSAFKRQVPMSSIVYQGALKRRRYSRFMLIGRK